MTSMYVFVGIGSSLWFVPGLNESQELLRVYNPHDDTIDLVTSECCIMSW